MTTQAQSTTQTTTPEGPVFTPGGLISEVGGGLVLVLLLFVVGAWVAKRLRFFSGKTGNGSNLVTVRHNQLIGQHGRLVVVEFNEQLLLLGVCQQNMQCLATMEKPAEELSDPVPAPFKNILKGLTAGKSGADKNDA
ncbi:TPA: flagellar biosynthetic protein FliO [Morganella morganii]|uniref:FliO/MopB family protein n=1 Tax=Morganella sp. GD04133 TaxID=2975435 RepID=UPI00244C36C4|nr:flagellar biosynthetic protein FliO [Morganella sp. GD04133]ELA9089275.1 flagellar biosynthetic protein FliO [Morganella morganii]MDH0356768.1 flagellar biosynthetic protein FliO [Morganella sp. GD04133]HEI9846524.1 flagellar biosynthetic protein FliO [Morganella morganii]